MDFFYQRELPEHVLDILSSEDESWVVSQDLSIEDYDKLKPNIPQIINKLCLNGQLIVLANDKVVVLIRRKTAWVCEIDTKVKPGTSVKDIIKSYKVVYQLLVDKTFYRKCESRTPFQKYARVMAKAMNASIEGVCKNSYRTREDTMIDEFLVGIVLDRKDTTCQ